MNNQHNRGETDRDHAARLARIAADLRALESITEVGISTLQLDELLNQLARRMTEVSGADSALILLIDETAGEVVPKAAFHIESGALREYRTTTQQGLAGKVIAEGRPMVFENADVDSSAATPYVRRRHIKSIIGMPLRAAGRILGVAYIYTTQRRIFTQEDIRRFEVMSDRAAVAVNNALLFQQLKASSKRLAEQTDRLRSILEVARDIDLQLEMINIVSHDIRTPVTIILGQAELIQRFADNAMAVRRSAEAIAVSARRMNTMISDIVDSTRTQAGQLQLKQQPVDLKVFIGELLDRSKAILDVGRIEVEIPLDTPLISADVDRLELIFTNLLGNALKYSPTETKVLVKVDAANREAIIAVSDCGTGITPEDIPHIFEPFYRGKGARGTEGQGLGLYIADLLVQKHGGRMWVESELGKGTTFYFALQVA